MAAGRKINASGKIGFRVSPAEISRPHAGSAQLQSLGSRGNNCMPVRFPRIGASAEARTAIRTLAYTGFANSPRNKFRRIGQAMRPSAYADLAA